MKRERDYMKRKAIKSKSILRVPIYDPKARMLAKCKEKLESLIVLGNATEEDILAVAAYYGYKVRTLLNLDGFNAISKKDPAHHKNWRFFANVCNLCIKHNWDTFIYIDSQFDRAEYWENSDGRIYPQQLCSQRAISHYYKYIKGKTEEHEADGTTLTANKIKTVNEEILDALVNDCKIIKNGIKYSTMEGTDTEKKIFVLYNNWLSLSAYYISSCDWLTETLEEYCKEINESDSNKVLEKVNKLLSNKKTRENVLKILKNIENKFEIPETPSKRELLLSYA
jgi:hypothetical protein